MSRAARGNRICRRERAATHVAAEVGTAPLDEVHADVPRPSGKSGDGAAHMHGRDLVQCEIDLRLAAGRNVHRACRSPFERPRIAGIGRDRSRYLLHCPVRRIHVSADDILSARKIREYGIHPSRWSSLYRPAGNGVRPSTTRDASAVTCAPITGSP